MMEWIIGLKSGGDFLLEIRELTVTAIVVRILVAVILGGIIGMERGMKNRPAGLRTYMLVCVGACVVMMINQYTYQVYGVGDPVRLGAQVVSGIGFLGAGTIIVTSHNQIKGLTTAATLWATACMGLAVGVGFYECALVMYVLLIFILLLVSLLDNRYLKVPTSTSLYLEVRRDIGLGDAIRFIHEIGWTVRDVKEFPSGRPDVLAVRMDLESEQAMREDLSCMHMLRDQEGVIRLEM